MHLFIILIFSLQCNPYPDVIKIIIQMQLISRDQDKYNIKTSSRVNIITIIWTKLIRLFISLYGRNNAGTWEILLPKLKPGQLTG